MSECVFRLFDVLIMTDRFKFEYVYIHGNAFKYVSYGLLGKRSKRLELGVLNRGSLVPSPCGAVDPAVGNSCLCPWGGLGREEEEMGPP